MSQCQPADMLLPENATRSCVVLKGNIITSILSSLFHYKFLCWKKCVHRCSKFGNWVSIIYSKNLCVKVPLSLSISDIMVNYFHVNLLVITYDYFTVTFIGEKYLHEKCLCEAFRIWIFFFSLNLEDWLFANVNHFTSL